MLTSAQWHEHNANTPDRLTWDEVVEWSQARQYAEGGSEWVSFTTRNNTTAWRNTSTGERRYQSEKPGGGGGESKQGTDGGGKQTLTPEQTSVVEKAVAALKDRKSGFGVSNAEQAKWRAEDLWFNRETARGVFKNRKEFAAAVGAAFDKPAAPQPAAEEGGGEALTSQERGIKMIDIGFQLQTGRANLETEQEVVKILNVESFGEVPRALKSADDATFMKVYSVVMADKEAQAERAAAT